MSDTLAWDILARDRMSDVLDKLAAAAGRLDKALSKTGDEAQQMGRKLDTVEAPASRLAGHMDRLGETAAKTVGWLKNIAITAGVAMLAAGGAASVFGIKQAASNEQAMISFELLLGSAEKAKAFLQDLQKFAAVTPFDMPSLRDAASRLLAVGTQAKDVIPLMTQIGNATAGMGTGAEGIGRAVYALQQIRQQGHAMMQDIHQLTDAGIPAMDALAAHFGKSISEVQDMISAGDVSADDVFAAIENGEGPAFQRLKGMMEKQSASLTGMWSTFKDNLGQSLASLFEPAMPGLKKLLDLAANAIPKVIGYVMDYGRRLTEIFKGTDVDEKFMAAIEKLGHELLPFVKKQLDHLLKVITDNREGLEKFGRFIADDVVPVVGGFLAGAFLTVIKVIEGTIWVIAHLVDWFKTMRYAVVESFKLMDDLVIDSLLLILEAADRAFGWIPGIGPKIHAAAVEFGGWVDSINRKLDELAGRTVDVTVVHREAWMSNDDYREIARRASGGPVVPGVVRVGENGPEELYLSGGGYVRPNNQLTAGGSDDVLGTLVVQHVGPDGTTIRTELLKLAKGRGFRTVDALLPVGS